MYDLEGITQYVESTEIQISADRDIKTYPNSVRYWTGYEHGYVEIENERHTVHDLGNKAPVKVYFDERANFAGITLNETGNL